MLIFLKNYIIIDTLINKKLKNNWKKLYSKEVFIFKS